MACAHRCSGTIKLTQGFPRLRADRLYAPVIDDEHFGYRHLNVEAQQAKSGFVVQLA